MGIISTTTSVELPKS